MTPDDRLRDLLADVRAEIDGAVGGRYDGLAWVARRIETMLAEGTEPRRHGREYTDPEVAAMYAQASAVDEWDAADHGLLQPMLDASVPAYVHTDGRVCYRRKIPGVVSGPWWPAQWESGQYNGVPDTGCLRNHDSQAPAQPNESRERQ